MSTIENRGKRYAVFLLITKIGNYSNEWFPALMWALCRVKLQHIVRKIDDMLPEAGNDSNFSRFYIVNFNTMIKNN